MDSIRPVYDNSLRCKGSPNSKFHDKIPNSLHLHLIKYIYTKQAKGNKVACREILNWLRKKHAVYCIKKTLLRSMLDIGKYYNRSKSKLYKNNVTRLDQIRDYFISLHAMLKIEKEGKAVLICLDRPYCNTAHSDMHSWHIYTGKPIQNKLT